MNLYKRKIEYLERERSLPIQHIKGGKKEKKSFKIGTINKVAPFYLIKKFSVSIF